MAHPQNDINYFIHIGAQFGGGQSAEKFLPMKRKLKELSEQYLSKRYCAEVDFVGIVWRVNGRLQSWPEIGPCRLRRSFKRRVVTMDIVFTMDSWMGTSPQELAVHIFTQLRLALQSIGDRLAKDKCPISPQFWDDFALFEKEYLQYFLAEEYEPEAIPRSMSYPSDEELVNIYRAIQGKEPFDVNLLK